jgi:hypothetical protein
MLKSLVRNRNQTAGNAKSAEHETHEEFLSEILFGFECLCGLFPDIPLFSEQVLEMKKPTSASRI